MEEIIKVDTSKAMRLALRLIRLEHDLERLSGSIRAVYNMTPIPELYGLNLNRDADVVSDCAIALQNIAEVFGRLETILGEYDPSLVVGPYIERTREEDDDEEEETETATPWWHSPVVEVVSLVCPGLVFVQEELDHRDDYDVEFSRVNPSFDIGFDGATITWDGYQVTSTHEHSRFEINGLGGTNPLGDYVMTGFWLTSPIGYTIANGFADLNGVREDLNRFNYSDIYSIGFINHESEYTGGATVETTNGQTRFVPAGSAEHTFSIFRFTENRYISSADGSFSVGYEGNAYLGYLNFGGDTDNAGHPSAGFNASAVHFDGPIFLRSDYINIEVTPGGGLFEFGRSTPNAGDEIPNFGYFSISDFDIHIEPGERTMEVVDTIRSVFDPDNWHIFNL